MIGRSFHCIDSGTDPGASLGGRRSAQISPQAVGPDPASGSGNFNAVTFPLNTRMKLRFIHKKKGWMNYGGIYKPPA